VLCIFCRNEREPSIEHVFPAAIGGALTIERVCKPCNDRLGAEVDAPLSNHRTILIKRQLLGIARRDGTQIGYEEILGHGKLVKDPDQRVRIVPEPGTGRWKHQLIYKSERIKSEDGTEIVRVTCDPSQAREVKKRIQRNRKREGLRSLSEIELQAEVDDKSKVVIEPSEVLHTASLSIQCVTKELFSKSSTSLLGCGWATPIWTTRLLWTFGTQLLMAPRGN
jgi:hypothetical protein